MTNTAYKILKNTFGDEPDSCIRFHTGYCGYVFHVIYSDKNYILKIYDEFNRHCAESTVFWLHRLQELDLQIPKVIYYNTEDLKPYVILSYIDGVDLGEVYSTLHSDQKKDIAKEIIYSQNKLKKLGANTGYGYLTSFNDPNQKAIWIDVIVEHLNRSKDRIETNNIFSITFADKVFKLLPQFSEYFTKIKAFPFFDDATTKNVLVHDGIFSGIIDLDSICFGDDLYTIALARMSLINMNTDTEYIDYLKEFRGINPDEEIVLDLYTLIFCLDFMSEKGMKFNRSEVKPVSERTKNKLIEIYNSFYKKLIDTANTV